MSWATEAVFYHIYPLGLLGAPRTNDFASPPEPRLERLRDWIPHIRRLGANAVYLGPVFEASRHGYDTANYYEVDRRLGTRETLGGLVEAFHDAGLRVVFDAVFNHVGRDFWAFRDLLARGQHSPYRDWFAGVKWDARSVHGDAFAYEGWRGHYDLVKLATWNPAVREHLFGATRWWLEDLGVDGLRLDAADCIEPAFLAELAAFCRSIRPDVWLLGEAIHGDYRRLANGSMLDSVTNYVAYKGLWSSLRDRNYWEMAYTLERQFGPAGDYRGLPLYSFADNHDVDRVAISLGDHDLLRPLYALLFTMPGVPSVYYGSEWGIAAQRGPDDSGVRPALDVATAQNTGSDPGLVAYIGGLAGIRRASPALTTGSYRQLHVAMEQFAFLRETDAQRVAVLLNAAPETVDFDLAIQASDAVDLLTGERLHVEGGRLRAATAPRSARIVWLS